MLVKVGDTVAHVCSFTMHRDVRIRAGGRTFRFEFSKQFGPAMLGKRGDIVSALPPQRSPFWLALECWCKQGYVVRDGYAVYQLPPREVYVTLAGRHAVQVPPGRDAVSVRAEWFATMGMAPPEWPVETFEVNGPIPATPEPPPVPEGK